MEINKPTTELKMVIDEAYKMAGSKNRWEIITVADVIYGFTSVPCIISHILADFNITQASMEQYIEVNVKDTLNSDNSELMNFFKLCNAENITNEHGLVDTYNFFKYMLKKPFSSFIRIANTFAIRLGALSYVLEDRRHRVYLSEYSRKQQETGINNFSEDVNVDNYVLFHPRAEEYLQTVLKPLKNINDKFCINLSKMAVYGKLDKVIGRDDEIDRTINILMRRRKNNPIILGEPGVGKTALVEGLAQRIAQFDVPYSLFMKIIISLDVPGMLAGCKYRGDFEERVKVFFDAVEHLDNVIVFVDEIHSTSSAGAAEGAISFADIVKPYLARGKICMIGATTLNEYKATIEKDGALDRRFEPIILSEPTERETFLILQGIREKYENYHDISIPDSVLKCAIELSKKYIQERNFPDKAIDVIDEAAAYLKSCDENSEVLTDEAIRSVIARKKHISVADIATNDISDFRGVKNKISSRLFGQENAVGRVMNIIAMSSLGITNEERPLASFLFIGSTGVGKTYFAKLLAEYLMPNKENFIRLDMSEYMEKSSVNKIVGSAPGYVGFDSTTGLTEKVRRNPNSIVLFDEIDKAHPDVLNLLLQLLDEGTLTDSAMRTVSFKSCIIILTANTASFSPSSKKVGFGAVSFSEEECSIRLELKKHIKPEILNRLDDIILFKQLTPNVLSKIIQDELNSLEKRLAEKGFCIKFDTSVFEHVSCASQKKEMGARNIKNYIKNEIGGYITECIISGNIDQFDLYNITYDSYTSCFKLLKCDASNSCVEMVKA